MGSTDRSSQHVIHHTRKSDVKGPGPDGGTAKNPILGAEQAARPHRVRCRDSSSYAKWCKILIVLVNLIFDVTLMQEFIERNCSREDERDDTDTLELKSKRPKEPVEEKTQVSQYPLHDKLFGERGGAAVPQRRAKRGKQNTKGPEPKKGGKKGFLRERYKNNTRPKLKTKQKGEKAKGLKGEGAGLEGSLGKG